MATFETRKTSTGEKRIRAVIRIAGFPVKRATFGSMKAARDWATVEEGAMREGRRGNGSEADRHTVAEMIDRYLEKVLPHKSKKKRYLRQQKQQLLWWRSRIGKYTLGNLTKFALNDARDELAGRVGASTVNRYMTALSHVFTIATDEWEWIKASPLKGVRRMKESKGRSRYLYPQERPKLLTASKQEPKKPLYLIEVLVIASGARKNEILTLKRKDVDIERGAATAEETKNGEKKTFFFSGIALQLLREYLEATSHWRTAYVFPNRFGTKPMAIDREFRRSRARAGIEDFTFHDLRHTHASYLAMYAGADTKVIQESLNQKTASMASRYTHLAKSHVARFVEEMNETVFNNQHNGEANAPTGK